MRVSGYRAHCWRTESHRNGDSSPSIGFRKQQNSGRCFVCDPNTWSNLDLVMLYRACSLRQAALWIAARFEVPQRPKGAHIKKRQNWFPHFRAGDVDRVVEVLVRSGIWCTLSHAERSLLPVLSTFLNRNTERAEISYQGLMRYSGVRSPATIAAAMRHFQKMGFLKITRARATDVLRLVNQYRFDFDDADFQALAAETFRRHNAEIELEREMRIEARKARSRKALLV
jgi:hypothetical protein